MGDLTATAFATIAKRVSTVGGRIAIVVYAGIPECLVARDGDAVVPSR